MRNFIDHFRPARATDRLFTWFGVHITKIHIYGAVAGGLTMIDFSHGEHGYGLLVLLLAALDLKDDIG